MVSFNLRLHIPVFIKPKEPLQRAITHHNIYIGDQFLYSQTELRHMEVYFNTMSLQLLVRRNNLFCLFYLDHNRSSSSQVPKIATGSAGKGFLFFNVRICMLSLRLFCKKQ